MKLPHWHPERLLPPSTTHTHTPNPHSSPTLCVRHCTNGHWEEPWGNKYMNIEIKSESKHRSAPIPPLSPAPRHRNRCQDINFHDVRNLGGGVAGKSSAVADYSCLCASVCSCVSVSPSPPRWDIIISDCLRRCLTFPFQPTERQLTHAVEKQLKTAGERRGGKMREWNVIGLLNPSGFTALKKKVYTHVAGRV